MPRVKRGVVARQRHKKILNKPKAITVLDHGFLGSQNKQLLKLLNMLIVIDVKESVNLELYGLQE